MSGPGILLLATLLLVAGCGPGGSEGGQAGGAEETATPAAEIEKPSTRWLLFRGDQEGRGISEETLEPPLELRWSFSTDDAVLATAVIDSGRAYVGSDSGIFYCLDLDSGESLWTHETEYGIEGTACLLPEIVVYGAKDGFVYALDRETGDLAWKYETEDQILGGVNAWELPGGGGARLVVGSYDYNLHCINAADGSAAWTFPTENYVNGTPTISEGRAIIGGCDGFLRMISVETGQELSTVQIDAYISNSVAVRDDIAYVAHYGNKVEAFDLATSEKVWEFSGRAFEYYASPAVTADRVFAAGRDKRLHCLDRMTGEQLWEFTARGRIDSSPVVCPGVVYFGSDDGRVYGVDSESGEEVWSYEIGAEIASSPAVADGVLVICGKDGVVYCFEGDAGAPVASR